MRYLIHCFAALLLCGCTSNAQLPLSVIPMPNQVERSTGSYKIPTLLTISYQDNSLKSLAKFFGEDKDVQADVANEKTPAADIQLIINQQDSPKGAYSLIVNEKGITIAAANNQGIFYGWQTLKQMLLFSKTGELPCVSINDAPRYAWRGLMLDESRYFFGKAKVKQLLDLMALHKLNVFHWHLTDVPGWRIEIKQYPRLATIGGRGNDIDPEAPAHYYSQQDIREIVQYAQARFIDIIPEIDMPGHARAANRAYPEFSGGGSISHPDFTFNPGYEGTYAYLTNILREVAGLFPSRYIHLGGDEVHFGNADWQKDKYVQQLMQREKLQDLKAVEAYFVNRMADSIISLGKIPVGWDEIIGHGLSPENSLVMWWRHDKPQTLETALQKNYDVILCPRIPLYFDFDQDISHHFGRKWKGAFASLDQVYAFPADTNSIFATYQAQIKGLQANIWTERIQSEDRLDFMTYPRMSALAEAAWTNTKAKNYHDFQNRLPNILNYLESKNIRYFNPFQPDKSPEPEGLFRRNLQRKN